MRELSPRALQANQCRALKVANHYICPLHLQCSPRTRKFKAMTAHELQPQRHGYYCLCKHVPSVPSSRVLVLTRLLFCITLAHCSRSWKNRLWSCVNFVSGGLNDKSFGPSTSLRISIARTRLGNFSFRGAPSIAAPTQASLGVDPRALSFGTLPDPHIVQLHGVRQGLSVKSDTACCISNC